MSGALHSVFVSERLTYRAIEDTEDDKAWFHSQIKNDPEAFGLGDSNILRPQHRVRSDEILLEIQKSLLGVIICLRQPASHGIGELETGTPNNVSTPIGVIGLFDENGGGYRHHHRLSVLSISLVAEHRGKGYGTEAMNWAIDWAFNRANIHCLSLGCLEYNTRGRRLYEKLGFVLEGRNRQSHWHERRWWDVLLYSMLEDEWVALRKLRKNSSGPVGVGIGEAP